MKGVLIAILLLSLAISGGLALWASEAPDGLEHAMEQTGIAEGQPVHSAPMADYEAGFLGNPIVRKVVAGVSGTLAVFGLILVWAWAMRLAGKRKRPSAGA